MNAAARRAAGDDAADRRLRALSVIETFVCAHTGLSVLVPELTMAEMGLDARQCAALVGELERSLGRQPGAGEAAAAACHGDMRASDLVDWLLRPLTPPSA